MSTLGDLLAEHTMLPGSAVDHLHAVVGEWQLLADLSFADYLMWVRRDDGSLVCVAQCRPNTAPTVLLRDAVGTVVDADRMPPISAAFESGVIRPGKRCGTTIFVATDRRERRSCTGALRQRGGRGADPPDRPRRHPEVEPAGDRLPGLRREPAAHVVARAPSPTWATWRCRGRARGSVTASSASTSEAWCPSPAPTRCRPTTGWA